MEESRFMKPYKPRRRRSNKTLQKQQLKDFGHLLEMDLNSFLILEGEGTPRQTTKAKQKMRSDLLKYGGDMETIGKDLGEGFPKVIGDYIKSMRKIAERGSGKVDNTLINAHRRQALELRQKAERKGLLDLD